MYRYPQYLNTIEMPQMYFIAEAFPSIYTTPPTFADPICIPLNYLFAYRNTVAMPLQHRKFRRLYK